MTEASKSFWEGEKLTAKIEDRVNSQSPVPSSPHPSDLIRAGECPDMISPSVLQMREMQWAREKHPEMRRNGGKLGERFARIAAAANRG